MKWPGASLVKSVAEVVATEGRGQTWLVSSLDRTHTRVRLGKLMQGPKPHGPHVESTQVLAEQELVTTERTSKRTTG